MEINTSALLDASLAKLLVVQTTRTGLAAIQAAANELRNDELIEPQVYYQVYNAAVQVMLQAVKMPDENWGDLSNKTATTLVTSAGQVNEYVRAQYAQHLIPRLYGMILMAVYYGDRSDGDGERDSDNHYNPGNSANSDSGNNSVRNSLRKSTVQELLDSMRGVQHPTRGLFVRHFLVTQLRAPRLPGSFGDQIDFFMTNLHEMVRLWVRVNLRVRDKKEREHERRVLAQLVGTPLVRISEIEAIDVDYYSTTLLPKLLAEVFTIKDSMAQRYLMEAIVQVFPAEYHHRTLNVFLDACRNLSSDVSTKDILSTLMNRLAQHAKQIDDSKDEILSDGNTLTNTLFDESVFYTLNKSIDALASTHASNIRLVDMLELQAGLINFATHLYPRKPEFADEVLFLSAHHLESAAPSQLAQSETAEALLKLLLLMLDDVAKTLKMQNYCKLHTYLPLPHRKELGIAIVNSVLAQNVPLCDPLILSRFLDGIGALLYDVAGGATNVPDRLQLAVDQQLVARSLHLIDNPDTDIAFHLYSMTRNSLGSGGISRIVYTLPTLIDRCLVLSRRISAREAASEVFETSLQHVLLFVQQTISPLFSCTPLLALHLFLSAAIVADQLGHESMAYEYVAHAFIIYEDEISDSKSQFSALITLIQSLEQLRSFTQDNFDILTGKALQHASKLLRKPDQTRALMSCAHLYWAGTTDHPSSFRNDKSALQCLQRSLKTGNVCTGQQAELFVEIFDAYLLLYDRHCPSITVKYLKGLISLIEEHMRNSDVSSSLSVAKAHYLNVLRHIHFKQHSDIDAIEQQRWLDIPIPNVTPSVSIVSMSNPTTDVRAVSSTSTALHSVSTHVHTPEDVSASSQSSASVS